MPQELFSELVLTPVMSIAPVVAAGIIGGVASLLGANKGAKSAKSAQSAQDRMAREALAEQKRIYDLEAQKEAEQRAYDRAQADETKGYDRAQTERVYGSRRNAFGSFDADLNRFSQGYAPSYGQSAAPADGMRDQRSGFSGGGGGVAVAPNMGDKGLGPGPDPMAPTMPPTGGTGFPGQMPGPGGAAPAGASGMSGGSMTSTVWLQAPTGETMEVPIDQAPMMMAQGAVLIPPPVGGS